MKHIISTLVLTLPLAMVAQTPILVKTFPNPTPAAGDRFSWSVAALGDDRVLIGAPYDGPTNAGAVYLFRTNGTLLTTFTNPSPAYTIWFGNPGHIERVALLLNSRTTFPYSASTLTGKSTDTQTGTPIRPRWTIEPPRCTHGRSP